MILVSQAITGHTASCMRVDVTAAVMWQVFGAAEQAEMAA